MLHLFLDRRPWFRAKSRGYGTGMPIAWQGWAMMAAHVALITGVVMLLREQPIGMVAATMVVGILPLPLYHAKTEGGWRWRWGTKADLKAEKRRRPRR